LAGGAGNSSLGRGSNYAQATGHKNCRREAANSFPDLHSAIPPMVRSLRLVLEENE
jgi:hypothetical protein